MNPIIRAAHAELARWARRKGWTSKGFGAWTNGSYTVSVSAYGYPKRLFSLVNCRTLDDWKLDGLADVERFLDYVRCTGDEPARI